MLKALAQYIENNTTLVIGDDLFPGYRPSNAPVECVALYERSGENRSFTLRDKRDVPVQFVSRSDDYYVARDWLAALITLLHGQCAYDLPVVVSGEALHIAASEILSGPVYMGQDEKGNHEFSLNVLFRVQDAI